MTPNALHWSDQVSGIPCNNSLTVSERGCRPSAMVDASTGLECLPSIGLLTGNHDRRTVARATSLSSDHHCTYDVDVDDTTRPANTRRAAARGRPPREPAAGGTISSKIASRQRITGRLSKTAAGILAPSFAAGATPAMHNMVLWTWGPHQGCSLRTAG
jgi:hypothetical protein